MAVCDVCFRHCSLSDGQIGFCLARREENGRVIPDTYGKITSLALDPIEKKPLSEFMPGSMILSAGSYGCNLRCPFCQNSSISYGEEVINGLPYRQIMPEELVEIALSQRKNGNVGIAFTYNEPLVGWEYIRDTGRLAKEAGLFNVLVSNGTAELSILREILPCIDAMNIDLKSYSESFYRDLVKGDRQMVLDFIEESAKSAHVEVTCLIIPKENDSEEQMDALAAFLHSVEQSTGRTIPLHVTRFFPRFHMTDRDATPVAVVYRLADVARRHLSSVYEGNV